mgnify:CR=1 FL=1
MAHSIVHHAEERLDATTHEGAPAAARPAFRTVATDDVTRADWERALALIRVAFNGGPGWFSNTADPIDHLLWKLSDFPGPALAHFTEDGDTLFGFTATLGRSWLVRGERRVATDLVDAALHPAVQGRVLIDTFRSLRRDISRWERADFAFGFASHPASLRNRGFQGKHDLGSPLETYVRPLDLVRFVRGDRSQPATGVSRTRIQIEMERRRRSSKPAIARLLAWQGRTMRQRLTRRPLEIAPQSSFDVRTIDHFDERFDAFVDRAAEAFDLIQVRDRQFLNWRYADDRAGQFTVRVAESDGEMLGYLALRTGRSSTDIADLLVLPSRIDVAHALIRDAVELSRGTGSSAIRSWMISGHPYEPLLTDLGFVRARTSTKPVFHANPRTDPAELAFLAEPTTRVHLMLGDSDHV